MKMFTGSLAAGLQSGIGTSTAGFVNLLELTLKLDRKRRGWVSLRSSAVCWNRTTCHWFGRWRYCCRGDGQQVRCQVLPSPLRLFIIVTSLVGSLVERSL